MTRKTYYKATSTETVAIPCYIENAYDNETYVSFQRFLNENFGSYKKATIYVPAELHPELVGEGYLSLWVYSGDYDRTFIEPASRVEYINQNQAVIEMTREISDPKNGTTFKKVYLRCKIESCEED